MGLISLGSFNTGHQLFWRKQWDKPFSLLMYSIGELMHGEFGIIIFAILVLCASVTGGLITLIKTLPILFSSVIDNS